MKISNSFTQGKMNKDLDERLIPKGQYRDALNIEVNASEGAGIGAVENVLGNTLVGTNYNYPAGETNLFIVGTIADQANDHIYFLVSGTLFDYVLRYAGDGIAIKTLLKDTKGRVLNFDPKFFITGINIVDNLLFWTDDKNPPRKINTTKQYQTDAFTEDDISVIVKPPLNAPLLVLSNTDLDDGSSPNNIEDKFLQFSYRYKYENDEYSAMSPFSATAFFPENFEYNYADAEFTSMVNKFNQVKITFNTGLSQVEEIQLLFRDTLDNTVFIIERFNKVNQGWGDNQSKAITFTNNKIFSVLPPDEVTRLFDNVPLKAKAQDIIGSRLIYGNYTQFFNVNKQIELELNYDQPSSSVFPKPTFKSNRDYEVGIAYLDDYGRMTTVFTNQKLNSSDGTTHIPISSSKNANDLVVKINNRPPSFSSKYRLFIKQNRGLYYNIFPLYYYIDGVYRWFRISQSDVDKVKEGDYIVAKANNDVAIETLEKYKVIEVGVQNKDFLGNDELGGLYFKIKNDNAILFDGSDIEEFNFETVGFAYSVEMPGSYSNAGVLVGNIDEPVYYGSRTDDHARLTILNLAGSGFSNYKMVNSLETQEYQRFRIYMDSTDHFSIYYFNGSTYERHGYNSQSIQIPANREVSVLSMAGGSVGTAVACKFQFLHSSGYTKGDYWIINILPSEGLTFSGIEVVSSSTDLDIGSNAILPGNSWSPTINSQVSFPQPGGLFTADRVIESGSRIRIRLKEEEKFGEGSWQGWQEWVSPRRYVNIQEWFWESGAHRTFKQFDSESEDSGTSNVYFRRGYNRRNRPGVGGDDVKVNYISQNNDAYNNANRSTILAGRPVYMFIMTTSVTNDVSKLNYMHAEMEVIMQTGLNVFETEGKENLEDVFYETRRTYDINTSGNSKLHGGSGGTGAADQTLNAPAIVRLNYYDFNSNFNAYSFGNGVESMVIRDDWNGRHLKYSPRANSTYEDYAEERVEEALTYSGVYRETSGINNLNEFNLSLSNFKYLDKSFGSIQKIKSRDTDLVIFQEDKVSKILYGKNLLSDAVGGGSIASIPEVLGTQISFSGQYGISKNPESFAQWGNNMYFTDEFRGAVCRLSGNGIFEISSFGMADWFKDLFRDYPGKRKLGGIDPFKGRYVLSSRDIAFPTITNITYTRT